MKSFFNWMRPVTDLVTGWIEARTGLCSAVKNCGGIMMPGKPCICRALPTTIVFAFIVQAITGLFMLLQYSSGAQSAWESVYYLQEMVPGGWLLRAVHHYSGQMILVLIAIHVVGMIVRGTYRAPREFVFWAGIFMGLVTLCLLLTGDLLAWDQNSLSCTQVRTNFLELLPLIGSHCLKLAVGGPGFGHLAIARFLVLHTVVLSGAFAGLLILQAWFMHRARKVELHTAQTCSTIWPNQAWLNVVGCLIVMAVILLLSLSHGTSGVTLGAPADTSASFDAARPEWAFLGLYGFADMFPAALKILPIFVIPGLLVLAFLVMPFLGQFKIGHVFNVFFVIFLLAGNAVLSFQVLIHDKHNEKHQAALREAEEAAARVKVLAKSKGGIPVGGALTLLREDPKTQGPMIFKQHCASCHDCVDSQGNGVKSEKASAPNLYGYATREWVAGWLDPEKISSEAYFGGTKFRSGKMAEFIEEMFEDLEDDEIKETHEEMMTAAIALSAQAKLTSQIKLDAKHAERIKKGNGLIEDDLGCADCHKFGNVGQLGTGPDLTGYCSREWTIGIIKNPAHKRFYGKDNDRMPAYAETDNEAANLLTNSDIEILADWLRGDWFEPVVAEEDEVNEADDDVENKADDGEVEKKDTEKDKEEKKAAPAAKPVAEPAKKPEAKPEPKPAAKPVEKPKAETKPAPKAEPEPAAKPAEKPMVQAKPEPKPAKQPESKSSPQPAEKPKTPPNPSPKPTEKKPEVKPAPQPKSTEKKPAPAK
ncbi:MAG: cytochrome b N-terminal domain-containing protein [Pirellulales bacterium]|nr:cytochrome b N-terminal domain-containing protein [Pirellulales bacterium]